MVDYCKCEYKDRDGTAVPGEPCAIHPRVEFRESGSSYANAEHPTVRGLFYLDLLCVGSYGGVGGYAPPAVIALIKAAPALLDGCNALLGLLQLIETRCDAELLKIIRSNHRVADAKAAVAKAAPDLSRST